VLLMDEPFGAVDPLTRERLQAEFARIQKELRKTVIFVTHDVDEAIRLGDRIALMRDGRLQQYDTPETLLDHPASKFVHDFMGADRALKRLGRVKVSDVMRRDVPTLRDDPDVARMAERASSEESRFVYITDAAGRLEGWFDRVALRDGRGARDAITSVDWRESAVRPDTSLKEALSRMLGQGFRSIAVVDDSGRLLGDVALAGIEATMTEGDAYITHPEGAPEAEG
jgi:osmoprotectant transport system ATP-binding protein